ncbi:MAG TPA: PadR family transcriptional regulator [Spirochaetia bacterium]|nr:PadR family transcriptional regulator [Spirochaetia bacterium]
MIGPHDTTSSDIEYALLGLLQERPMHGYELAQILRTQTGLGLIWEVKQSNLYGLLAKLERERFVFADRQDQPNRPARKIYHLTDAGARAVESWIRNPVTHGRSIRVELLAKLYFAEKIDRKAAAELIASQKAACRNLFEAIRRRRSELGRSEGFDRMVYEFRAGQLRSTQRWLDRCAAFYSVDASGKRVPS